MRHNRKNQVTSYYNGNEYWLKLHESFVQNKKLNLYISVVLTDESVITSFARRIAYDDDDDKERLQSNVIFYSSLC